MEVHGNHLFMLQFLFVSLLLLLSVLLFSLYTRRRRRRHRSPPPVINSDVVDDDYSSTSIENLKSHDSSPNNALLLEILPVLLENNDNNNDHKESMAVGDEECGKKKKKKRGRKKRLDGDELLKGEVVIKDGGLIDGIGIGIGIGIGKEKEEKDLVCLYPFTSSSSATQRKIKQQYDELVKSHESNGLTLLQVGQFVNCLIEARDELKHKSEVIHRKFTITKALLFKADRSSFDRLRQQIYKLELEQKRVEEDAFVYNWLQQQLKLSPAYKKMLEIGAYMESNAKSVEQFTEDTDSDIYDISFEELLAREKKDTFWQKKGKSRSGSWRVFFSETDLCPECRILLLNVLILGNPVDYKACMSQFFWVKWLYDVNTIEFCLSPITCHLGGVYTY